MAASEVRIACRHMANCSFVQEDAKRAPKVACYPSSSSKQLPDSSNGDSIRTDQPASSSWSLKQESLSNLQPDTKWWLHLHPNFVRKEVTCEQLNALEKFQDSDILTSKPLEDEKSIAAAYGEIEKKYSSLGAPWKCSSDYLKLETEASTEELSSLNDNLQQVRDKAELGGCWYENEDLMDWGTFDQIFPKNPGKGCSDLETPWIEVEKSEPWWRAADKNELASLVAQKSFRHVENCDLPRPQKMHFCRDPLGSVEAVDDCRPLSLDPNLQGGTFCTLDCAHKSCTSGSMDQQNQISGEVGHYVYGSEKAYSDIHSEDPPVSKHHDPSKAELLEALCHSQTRAREAEMAARKAYDEKEHIVKLFFKQASHVFAYKQWTRMLQLESFLLQLKLKEHQISSLFPVLPWSPLHGNKFGCGEPKAKKRGHPKHQKCNFCKYAVAFAVGFGLASVGLLLGWSFGWLLPAP
ncbi:hypothetical protein Taro_027215 [Colocasia esculenta]|uniref:Uncharacterized protein n=1 Tax=Colocasia esculenta TaxID=4460 RepID=A0A843VHG4_COLES|nr:hypothetical protein [Colocasia esculenta]